MKVGLSSFPARCRPRAPVGAAVAHASWTSEASWDCETHWLVDGDPEQQGLLAGGDSQWQASQHCPSHCRL